jgi:hypothetical protein
VQNAWSSHRPSQSAWSAPLSFDRLSVARKTAAIKLRRSKWSTCWTCWCNPTHLTLPAKGLT